MGVTNVGEAAHISAATADGPRYDSDLTVDERRHAENGIWLCVRCHTFVDGEPAKYTVEELQRWKVEAENRAFKELIYGVGTTQPEWFGEQPGEILSNVVDGKFGGVTRRP